MAQPLWAGIDAGKSDHYCWVIDADGTRLLSRRVANDEAALQELINAVTALADGGEVTWVIDLNAGGAALLITSPIAAEQRLLYIPGRTVHHASGDYRGEGKTDAKDAAIIADQARMRRGPGDDIAVELRILTSRRTDLVTDRTRAINRLRAQLLEYFPALERAFDYSANKAALILLTGYQTPDGLRRAGAARLTAWLRKRMARNANAVVAVAIQAANSQHIVVPGQQLAAAMVARMAEEVMALDTEISDADAMIEERFRRHRHFEIILSMPGFGVILGAEFLAATSGDMAAFNCPDRLAAVCGLAPVPRDSGRISGNLKRPRRYNRRLLRACYLAAHIAISTDAASRIYYERKRTEGKRHTQAVLALARRRINVLWAMLRDRNPYQPTAPATRNMYHTILAASWRNTRIEANFCDYQRNSALRSHVAKFDSALTAVDPLGERFFLLVPAQAGLRQGSRFGVELAETTAGAFGLAAHHLNEQPGWLARHRVSLLHAHLVFVTKYRRPVFTGPMLTFCEHTLPAVCGKLDVELVEFNGEPDHVHLLMAYPPTLAISTLVQQLKGRTAYAVRREYTGACVRARMRGHLWSPSYFAVSCGGAPLTIIKQYIDGQARPLRAPDCARRQTGWANPGLKSEACAQESGHPVTPGNLRAWR